MSQAVLTILMILMILSINFIIVMPKLSSVTRMEESERRHAIDSNENSCQCFE